MKKIISTLLSCLMGITLLFSACSPSSETKIATLTLFAETANVEVGAEYTIEYLSENTEEVVKFTSSDPNVATVNEQGVVVGVSSGTANITVSVGELFEKMTITVVSAPTYGIWCANAEILLMKGNTFAVDATVKKGGESVSDASISYLSCDSSVFTVNETGVLTAVGIGEAQLQLTCAYKGKELSEFVDVKVCESAKLNVVDKIDIAWQNTRELEYSIVDLEGKPIENAVAMLTSSDESILSVSENALTAEGLGTATLTLSYAGCQVDVDVRCFYEPLKNEFNAFRHDDIFAGLRTHEAFHLNNSSYAWGKLQKTNEALDGNMDLKAKFIPVRTDGSHMRYTAIFVPCMQTKSQLLQLKKEGYTNAVIKVYFNHQKEVLADQLGTSTLWVQSDLAPEWAQLENNQIHYTRNNQQWLEFPVPIDKIIENYEALETQTIPLFKVLNNLSDTAPHYTMYLAPIMFA